MKHEEYIECVNFHHWLEVRGIRHTHIVNEGNGNYKRGAMNKKMGVSAGFPDYIILLPVGKFKSIVPVAIEMKRKVGGSVSKVQQKWLNDLAMAGFKTAVCKGCVEAVAFLRTLGYKDGIDTYEPF